MNIVIVGHVDHGKSTIIGRLLADTHSLPDGKLEQVRQICRSNSKPFEYAFLLDTLKDERAQGITIDAARCFFRTNKRDYIIIDAPGHIEFLKNMVTGASIAEAALLVIDAQEGIQENSRRHGYMLSMLGIKYIVVLVSKMDLVGYDQKVFKAIVNEYGKFLKKIDITLHAFIPVSGINGDAIAMSSNNMQWYNGPTVLDVLDAFQENQPPQNRFFRMPVQDVYKFTKNGDNRRIVSGTIESGRVSVGDRVVFYPSGKKGTINSIESFNHVKYSSVGAGDATGFTLREQIYITRGEIATLEQEQKPQITSKIKVNLFWLGKEPMEKHKTYYLKLGTTKTEVKLEEIISVMDTSTLENSEKQNIERHDVAKCIFKTSKAIAFDCASDFSGISRFVIVDNYEIAGGGIIQESLLDEQDWVRKKILLRNYKWESTAISAEKRAEKYKQKSTMVLITGHKDSGKKTIARILEEKLFNHGKFVYFLGIGNVLYGVDADIKNKDEHRQEHLRRFAEVAHILLDTGVILILTAIDLNQEEVELIKTTANIDLIVVVWVGLDPNPEINYDLHISSLESEQRAADRIGDLLQNRGIIF